MSRYLPYNPDQGYLVPPRVEEVLDADHLCFFIHRVVERLDLGGFEEAYSAAGGMLYHPSLMLKVWLYAYALGVTSSRRLEQRLREDLAFRYLAGNARPDYWALHGRDRGLGRPSHRGPAGHRAVHRQRLAGPYGGAGEEQLRLAARACDRRQRLLLQPQRRTDGSAGHRCLRAGLEPGPGTESWTPGRRPSLPRSQPAPHAREDALRAGQAPLPQAQIHRRTGLRSAQATTQPARVPSALPRQGGHRVRPRRHRLQPHPHPPLPLTQTLTLTLTQPQAPSQKPIPRLTHTITPNPPRPLTQTLKPCAPSEYK